MNSLSLQNSSSWVSIEEIESVYFSLNNFKDLEEKFLFLFLKWKWSTLKVWNWWIRAQITSTDFLQVCKRNIDNFDNNLYREWLVYIFFLRNGNEIPPKVKDVIWSKINIDNLIKSYSKSTNKKNKSNPKNTQEVAKTLPIESVVSESVLEILTWKKLSEEDVIKKFLEIKNSQNNFETRALNQEEPENSRNNCSEKIEEYEMTRISFLEFVIFYYWYYESDKYDKEVAEWIAYNKLITLWYTEAKCTLRFINNTWLDELPIKLGFWKIIENEEEYIKFINWVFYKWGSYE